MQEMFKSKKILGGIAVVILAVLVLGGFLVLSSKKSSTAENQQTSQEEQVLILSPDEIGLSLEKGKDENRVIMKISKVEGISSIEYQMTYNSEGDIPRGVTGNLEVNGKLVEKEIYMGTCSDVCHPDKGASDIKIIVKVVKTDGKVYQVEKSLEN